MAGVPQPTSLLSHQHLTLLPLLATPKAHQIYTFNVFGHISFENDSPPMAVILLNRKRPMMMLLSKRKQGPYT